MIYFEWLLFEPGRTSACPEISRRGILTNDWSLAQILFAIFFVLIILSPSSYAQASAMNLLAWKKPVIALDSEHSEAFNLARRRHSYSVDRPSLLLLGFFLRGVLVASFLLLATGDLQAKKKGGPRSRGLETPLFSPSGGIFASNVTLSLSLNDPSPLSVIVFTTDGSEPGERSSRYIQPIALTNSVVIRARVLAPGEAAGLVRSEDYTLVDEDLRGFTSNLALMVVNTIGIEPSRDRKNHASLRLLAPHSGQASLLETAHFEGRALLNIRGRASLRYPKRSYTVKLVDDQEEDRPASLLGMPRDENWILYAPYPDKTLMRDVLAYEMSRAMGHWAPRTEFIELFITQGQTKLSRADYAGVYVLEERINRHPARVNIQKLESSQVEEPEVSGGYIFKKDHVDRGYFGAPDLLGGGTFLSSSNKNGFPTPAGGFPADPKGFLPTYRSNSKTRESSETSSSSSTRRTSRGSRTITNLLTAPVIRDSDKMSRSVYTDEDGSEIIEKIEEGFTTSNLTNQFYWVEPEEDEVTGVQKAWLKHYLDGLERTLYGSNFVDRATGYRNYLDTPSAIDYHLLVEVTKNVDGHRFSTFFTKDRGGKVRFEPAWDWNLSFGNCNGKQGWIPEYWFWPQLSDAEYTWYRRLFDDPDFGQEYVDRWTNLRTNILSTSHLIARIDELALLLRSAQERNFIRWPILGKGVNPNYFFGETYAEEVAWMKDWLVKRLTWIEAQFVAPPAIRSEIRPDGSLNLIWKLSSGDLVFTLDGTDPRAPGGGVAARASSGPPPDAIPRGAELFARMHHEGRWSGPTRLRN